jgi:hypothetical protein
MAVSIYPVAFILLFVLSVCKLEAFVKSQPYRQINLLQVC